MYDLEYQSAARQDMVNIVTYISKTLSNPAAAQRLADEFIDSAEKIRDFPYSMPIYHPLKALKYEYRKLLVGNYIVFYRVDENKKRITMARVIYAKRNYNKVLE